MEFNSLAYAIFFATFVALYFAPFMRTAQRQNMLVLTGSYFFYGSWDWRFLGLIMLTTLSSFLCGLAIDRWHRRVFLVVNIVLNIGVLFLFKYFNFFSENLVNFLKLFGLDVDWAFVNIVLPVGISFYTFQAVGYTVDVWRKIIPPSKNLLIFSSFIAYFPQLVAGPIEKAANIIPQLSVAHKWNYAKAVEGVRQILWGMLKKVAVADPCGAVANLYLNADESDAFGIKIYVALVLFSVQLYCDFSGYSDIAQGSARVLGVDLMCNFKRPFFSRSFLELWRRWHVSLMDWFKDYVYIPLGGSRCGTSKAAVNLIVVFSLSGLWHGAKWGWVLWGVYCGIVCLVEKWIGVSSYKKNGAPVWRDWSKIFVTFTTFIIGLALFRANDVVQSFDWIIKIVIPISVAAYCLAYIIIGAISYLSIRFLKGSLYDLFMALSLSLVAVLLFVRPSWFWFHLYYFVAIAVFACEWRTRQSTVTIFPIHKTRIMRFATYLLLYLLILTYGFIELPPMERDTQFFYFQF